MIRIEKDYSARPVSIDFHKPSVRKRIADKIGKGTKDSGIYRGDVEDPSSVVSKLFALYNFKCAFCESDMRSTQSDLEVEHYRPARPKHPKKDQSADERLHHDGYPWLVYEWSNLLLACGTCNGRKGTRFPIAGRRARRPFDGEPGMNDLKALRIDSRLYLDEEPQLLNPEVDDPRDHFDFERDGTLILTTERAKTTEVLCRLNRRLLIASRRAVLNTFLEDLKRAAFLVLQRQQEGKIPDKLAFEQALEYAFRGLFESLDAAISRKESYTAFRDWFRDRYEDIVDDALSSNVARILQHARALYRTRWSVS